MMNLPGVLLLFLAAWFTGDHELAVASDHAISIVNVETGESREILQTEYNRPLVWSPDGETLIYWDHSTGGWDLWVCDPDGGNARNLTPDTTGGCRSARYSPDGSQIAFMRDFPEGLWLMNADGSGLRQLTEHGHRDDPPQWSPDGARLAFTVLTDSGTRINQYSFDTQQAIDLGRGGRPQWRNDTSVIMSDGSTIVELEVRDGDVTARNNVVTEGTLGTLSPTQSALAYVRVREGGCEMRVRSLSEGADRLLARMNGLCDELSWSPDGQLVAGLIIRGPDSGLHIIDVETGERIRHVPGELMFTAWRPSAAGSK